VLVEINAYQSVRTSWSLAGSWTTDTNDSGVNRGVLGVKGTDPVRQRSVPSQERTAALLALGSEAVKAKHLRREHHRHGS